MISDLLVSGLKQFLQSATKIKSIKDIGKSVSETDVSSTAIDTIKNGLSKILNIKEVDKEVDLVDLDSTAIDYIEYDFVAKILQVTFTSGSTYGYAGIDQAQVESLINSSSVGATFVREIRNNYIYWRM